MSQQEIDKWVENTISDLFTDWFYYDRKEDEDMSSQQLEQHLQDGKITRAQIEAEISKALNDNLTHE